MVEKWNEFPAILPAWAGSKIGTIGVPIAAAVSGLAGKPRLKSLPLLVSQLLLGTCHINAFLHLSVGMRPDMADQVT